VFLYSQLARGLTASSRGFLARQVADPQLTRVDHQAAAVDQHLRLPGRRLHDGSSLEDSGHPDTPAIDLGFEVRKDLVVFVHLDAVETHKLTGALQRVDSRLSV
jgi:hypothetical protein